MPALLHNDTWREMGRQFQAFDMLTEVEKLLSEGLDSHDLSRTLQQVRLALRDMHPGVKDPAVRKEYEQRMAGTFGMNAEQTQRREALQRSQAGEMDELRRQLAQANEAIAKLQSAQGQGTSPQTPGAKAQQ